MKDLIFKATKGMTSFYDYELHLQDGEVARVVPKKDPEDGSSVCSEAHAKELLADFPNNFSVAGSAKAEKVVAEENTQSATKDVDGGDQKSGKVK